MLKNISIFIYLFIRSSKVKAQQLVPYIHARYIHISIYIFFLILKNVIGKLHVPTSNILNDNRHWLTYCANCKVYDDTLKVMDIKNNNIKTVIVEKKTYTPWFVVRHKVDWYILDAVSAR